MPRPGLLADPSKARRVERPEGPRTSPPLAAGPAQPDTGRARRGLLAQLYLASQSSSLITRKKMPSIRPISPGTNVQQKRM